MSEQRTERPTRSRLERARREGVVAVSPAPGIAVGFGLALTTAALLLPAAAGRTIALTRSLITGGAHAQPAELAALAQHSLMLVLVLVAPIALACMLGVLVAGAAQSGGLVLRPLTSAFSGRALAAALKQTAPTPDGLARILSDAIKLSLLGLLTAATLWQHKPELLTLTGIGPEGLLEGAGRVGQRLALRLGLLLALIAVVEVLRTRYSHRKRLRMTPRELREELRQSEGDPRLKSRRREQARKLIHSHASEANHQTVHQTRIEE